MSNNRIDQEELNKIQEEHNKWQANPNEGKRADLSFKNLCGLSFSGDWSSTSFFRTKLTGADLRGADLTGATLTGAKLMGATLTGAILKNTKLPESLSFIPDPDLKSKILASINTDGNYLNMHKWYYCDTTHCLGGWAVTLHPDGKRLEENSSTYLAARLLLGLDHKEAEIFFSDEDEAIKFLKNK